MTEADAKERIGSIVRNLQSFEFMLRAALLTMKASEEPQVDDAEIVEGAEVEENSFTNYKSLGQLIDEYNSISTEQKIGKRLGKECVEIRDMFAHGRIFHYELDGTPTLYKFGKRNAAGKIPVEKVVVLSNEWLGDAITSIRSDMLTVEEVLENLGKISGRA